MMPRFAGVCTYDVSAVLRFVLELLEKFALLHHPRPVDPSWVFVCGVFEGGIVVERQKKPRRPSASAGECVVHRLRSTALHSQSRHRHRPRHPGQSQEERKT